jgi:hypothetical protein
MPPDQKNPAQRFSVYSVQHLNVAANSERSRFQVKCDYLYNLRQQVLEDRAAMLTRMAAIGIYRRVIVNLPKLTPSSTPVPLPASARETSPLVMTPASDDLPAPAAALPLI